MFHKDMEFFKLDDQTFKQILSNTIIRYIAFNKAPQL
jgi:hypothetical protein